MAIVEDCPAFSDGCPFSKLDANILPEIMEQMVSSDIREKCPAFKDGCPFRDMDSVSTLYDKLSDMPTTHQPSKDSVAAKAVADTLKLVHLKSAELKAKLNKSCPVFATSCPFKTVTTYGAPLISELDDVVERWGLPQHVEAPKESSGTAEPLSKSLKTGTLRVHRSAENVHFVRDFLKGTVPKEAFIELTRAYYHVYYAMEVGLRKMPKHLMHCDFSVLERADALAADLRHILDTPDGQEVDFGTPSPATQEYVDQIHLLAKEDPLLLLAHAYTRYMGDLSGGQILSRAAEKAYGFTPDKGLSFFRFEKVGASAQDIKAFKKVFRSSLDALQLSARRADALVHEANKAFLLNILLFQERDVAAGHLGGARSLDELWSLVEENTSALTFQRAYGAAPAVAPSKASKCPFLPQSNGSESSPDAACPWPFLWTHDPKLALVTHPLKNGIAFIGILGLLRIAWDYPKRSAAAFFSSGLLVPWVRSKKKALHTKPSKASPDPHDDIVPPGVSQAELRLNVVRRSNPKSRVSDWFARRATPKLS